MIPPVVEARVRDAIRAAKFYCAEIVRVYPPLETGEPQEVLFTGKPHGEHGTPDEQLTAYVIDGRDAPPATIAVGW